MSNEVHIFEIRLPPFDRAGLFGFPAAAPSGVVLFAHGSGSSHNSPRNLAVAESLRRAGFAFLLFDLLTEAEAAERTNIFDIPLLADRLDAASNWVGMNLPCQPLPLGYFGASTGAAAALTAASKRRDVCAIVSRGGRPDLAGAALSAVTAPTLLIVGGDDPNVLAMNRAACRQLQCECRLQVIPGATHLFEEPGALDTVTTLARNWFLQHLHANALEVPHVLR